MGYNPSTHICDGSAAYPAICNGKPYNPLEDGCCGSAIFNLANDKRCQKDVVETKCGESWYDATNANLYCATDGVVYSKCNGMGYNPSTQFCHTDNTAHYKCNGSNYNPSTQYCFNNTTPKNYDSITYEDKTYKTVVIGEQTWMAENLNYNASGSKCFNNDPANCVIYGRLYDWATAMGMDTKYNNEEWGGNDVKHQGICPSGWHLPSYDEWQTLVDFAGGDEVAGRKLRVSSGWNGEDAFGFSALPGGFGGSDGYFIGFGNNSYWWSASEAEDWFYSAYFVNINGVYYDDEDVSYSYRDKNNLYSVRCLQD